MKAKKTKANPKKLIRAADIGRSAWDLVWKFRKHFLIIIGFYTLAYLLIAQSGSSLASVSSTLNHDKSLHHGAVGGIYSGFSTYGSLLGNLSSANSPGSGAFQTVLFISFSLVVIWSIKRLLDKKSIKVRDAFYKSSAPLIPFFLILLLIGIQLLPMLVAARLYAIVISGGVAVLVLEKIVWLIVFGLLSWLSFYFVTSSSIALYLVSSGQYRPMEALKASKKLVKGRRMVVFGKIIFLPVSLTISLGIIMLPIILIMPAVAAWFLFLLILASIVVSHGYMYILSQELQK